MPVLLYCPDCNAKIRAPEQIIGRQVRCPKCDAEFTAATDGAAGPTASDSYPVSQPAAPLREEPVSPPPTPVQELKPEPPPAPVPSPPAPSAPPEQMEWKEPAPAREPSYPSTDAAPPANPIADFLLFRTMVAPLIVQIVFWIGVILCVLGGFVYLVLAIGIIFDGRAVGPGVAHAFGALGLILVGPLLIRIYCELLILFFRIYDTLREILSAAERQRRQG